MRNYIDWTDPLIVGLPLCQICAFEKTLLSKGDFKYQKPQIFLLQSLHTVLGLQIIFILKDCALIFLQS